MNILIIDDVIDYGNYLKTKIKLLYENCYIKVVSTCFDILSETKLHITEYDFVFLDINMPDISGPEYYISLVKEMPKLKNKIILMTGLSKEELDNDFVLDVIKIRNKKIKVYTKDELETKLHGILRGLDEV